MLILILFIGDKKSSDSNFNTKESIKGLFFREKPHRNPPYYSVTLDNLNVRCPSKSSIYTILWNRKVKLIEFKVWGIHTS